MDPKTTEFLRLWAESGWRGNEIARRLGIHPSNIVLYRKGKVIPPISKLRLLAEILGQTLHIQGEDATHRSRVLADWEVRLLGVAARIPPDSRDHAIDAFASMITALAPAAYHDPAAPVGRSPSLNRDDAGKASVEEKVLRFAEAVAAHVERPALAKPSAKASRRDGARLGKRPKRETPASRAGGS